MTAKDYTRSRATASRLIAKFGTAGAIRRTVVVDDTPWIPGSGTTTITDHACTLVSLEYDLKERESSLIEERDRKVLVSAEGLAVEPALSDQVVIGGISHAIIHVAPLRPADVTIMYQLQARA